MLRKILSCFLILALLFSLTCCAAKPSHTEESQSNSIEPAVPQSEKEAAPKEDSDIHPAIKTALEYSGANSVQYAVWDNGDITISGQKDSTYQANDTRTDSNSLYGVGSISKLYTTVAILELAEEGKIDLDLPITEYLPDFSMEDERYARITVRMLLNHSSCLMGYYNDNAMLFDDTDRSSAHQMLEKLSSQRLVADPGSMSSYCNTGFTLAELIVESVSGQSFPNFVRERILAPLKLDNTYAPEDSFDDSRRVKTNYRADADTPMPMECVAQLGGIGGYYAIASDIASFGGELTQEGLLSQNSLNAMSAPEYEKGIWPTDHLDVYSFGLGWDNVETFPFSQNNIQALCKTGDTLFYHSALVVLPNHHMAAAVLFSGGTSDYARLAANRLLIDALEQKGITVDESLPEFPDAQKAEPPQNITDYMGFYGSSMMQLKLEFDTEKKLLLTNLSQGETKQFCYYSDGSFRAEDGSPWLLSFIREKNGDIYLYQKNYDDYQELGILPWSYYVAMKLPENQISEELQERWNTAFYASLPVNEKYTSIQYARELPREGMSENIPEKIPGYVDSIRIIDECHAEFIPKLPQIAGRDGRDLTLEEIDDVTYLKANARVYIPEIYIRPLTSENGQLQIDIERNGYAKWFRTGSLSGKEMAVTMPEHGGFYVYDKNGVIVASSVLWNDVSVRLPENGYLVFAADAGSSFQIQLYD